MRCRVRLAGLIAVWTVAAVVVGCETFGLSPPSSPLLPETKLVRDAAPVPAPLPRELAKELHPAFAVEPGDTLLVQPAELDAPIRVPPDQPVFPDGTIDLGIYGRPVVAGKTADQIEAQVSGIINAKEKPKEPIKITVRIIGRVSKVYYVLGEVNAPGAFPITGRETVLDGIIAAGGLSRRASQMNIVMSRPTLPEGCRVVYPVCYPQIVQLGDTTTNYQIFPGDRIFVPSQGLFESLLPGRFRQRGACPACTMPQVPCGGAACPPGSGAGIPIVPFTPAAPVSPDSPSIPSMLPTVPLPPAAATTAR